MDPADFNKKVWEATIAAQFQLAGIRGFDPKTQAFLIPSGSVQNGFPGLTNQNTTELQNFNAQLYQLADQMPLPSAVQWSPATNRRYANYGVYLDYAASGAKGNRAYQIAYQVAQTNYTNELKVWSPIKKAAQTAYASAGSNKTFADWVKTDYSDSDTYLNEQATVGRLKSALDTASAEFYGPLWNTLNQDRQTWDLGQQAYISSDTLGYNMDCGNAGVNPAYNIDRNGWATTYLGWISQATANPPPKPSASVTYTIDSDSSTDLTEFGMTTTHTEASTFFEWPFMFWGGGSYQTTTERQDMYQKISFNNAKITMTSLVQPVSYPIYPGKWYSSDLTTIFPNLLAGAPNPSSLMYPYAATLLLAYNVGFQVSLESSVYQSLKSTVTTETSGEAVVGFMGWLFGEVGGTYNNRTVSTFEQLSFDDTSNTVSINPDNNGIPTILGVIVGKGGATGLESAVPRAVPAPDGQVQPSSSRADAAFALLSATKAFISDLSAFFSSLTRQQRAVVASAIKKMLQQRDTDEFGPLIDAVEDIVSPGRFGDQDSNEITVEQFFRDSALTITVRNTSGGMLYGRDEPTLKFSTDAQHLVGLLSNQASLGKAGGTNASMASVVILRALAALARIKAPANLEAKASLVPDLVQELTMLGVSSVSDFSSASTVANDENDDNINQSPTVRNHVTTLVTYRDYLGSIGNSDSTRGPATDINTPDLRPTLFLTRLRRGGGSLG